MLPTTQAHSVTFDGLLQRLDSEFGNLACDLIKRSKFSYDGLAFDVWRVSATKGARFI